MALRTRRLAFSQQAVREGLGVDLDVLDPETMQPVPRDGQTLGEVMFRGNVVMKGYLKNKTATAAAFAGAVGTFAREASTGALTQRGCITVESVSGCTLGYEFAGINAFTVAPKGADVYATSLTSNSLTTFQTTSGGAGLAQPPGPEREVEKESGHGKETVPAAEGTPSPDGCTVFLRWPGCGFGVTLPNSTKPKPSPSAWA